MELPRAKPKGVLGGSSFSRVPPRRSVTSYLVDKEVRKNPHLTKYDQPLPRARVGFLLVASMASAQTVDPRCGRPKAPRSPSLSLKTSSAPTVAAPRPGPKRPPEPT